MSMITDQFSNAVDAIVTRDPRFERDAYFFVRDALDFTTKGQRRKTVSGGASQTLDTHVTGQQLLEGVRQYAIKQYGPMVLAVFEHWRVRRCEDIGALVFNLIEARVFGKTDNDTIEDFGGGYDFEEAFVKPFRSSRQELAAASAAARTRVPSRSAKPKAE